MKKFLLLLFAIPLNIFAQNYSVDSVFITNCLSIEDDTVSGVTIDSVKYIFNTDNNRVSTITQTSNYADDSLVSVMGTMDSLIYDTAAHTITTLSGNYISDVFYPTSGRIVKYDSLNRRIKYVNIDAVMQPQFAAVFFYLSNNLIDYSFHIEYSGGVMTDTSIIRYSYDSLWEKTKEVTYLWRNGAELHPTSQQIFYYDTLHNLSAYNSYFWVDSTIGFDPCYDDTAWFVYNSSNMLIMETHQFCTGGGYTGTIHYDSNGVIDSTHYISYSHNGDLVDQYCSYERIQITTGISFLMDREQSYIYPNPVVEHLIINSAVIPPGVNQIQIRDLLGRIVFSEMIDNKPGNLIDIDAVNINPGMYILTINGKYGINKSIKFLKQ